MSDYGRWFKREVIQVGYAKRNKRQLKSKLSKCRECGREFSSSRDVKCPKCGADRDARTVTIKVQCSGSLHRVTITPFGRAKFHNHDANGMRALEAFRAAGDTTRSGCLECLDWLKGKHDPARRDVGAIIRQHRAVSMGRAKAVLPTAPDSERYLQARIAKIKLNSQSLDHRSLDPVANSALATIAMDERDRIAARAVMELRKIQHREWNFIRDIVKYRNVVAEDLKVEIFPIPANGNKWIAGITNQYDYAKGETYVTSSRLTIRLPLLWSSWVKVGLGFIGYDLVTRVVERDRRFAVVETVLVTKGAGDEFSTKSCKITARRLLVEKVENEKSMVAFRELSGMKLPLNAWRVEKVLKTTRPVDFIDSSEHLRSWDSKIVIPSRNDVEAFTRPTA